MAQELRLPQNDLEARRDELAKIIGTAPGALAELPYGVQLPAPQPARVADWSNQAEASSLDVLRAQLLTRIAGREIQIAKSGHYPIAEPAGHQRQRQRCRHGAMPRRASPSTILVGVVPSIPLYCGRRRVVAGDRRKCSWSRRRAD